ncbi:MAG TPA: hypothetical protein VJ576_01225 [Rhodocyclaceae bacterium]|nr:hypothetical protein [Rhodocyclaceae bacterium]
MATIIAGHFEDLDQARAAVDELARRDFAANEYAAYLRRPGLGLFDLFGTVGEADDGPMVAVRVDRPGTEAAAILILSRCGAWEIERAEGTWGEDGWQDYDPHGKREILKEIPAPGHPPAAD